MSSICPHDIEPRHPLGPSVGLQFGTNPEAVSGEELLRYLQYLSVLVDEERVAIVKLMVKLQSRPDIAGVVRDVLCGCVDRTATSLVFERMFD